MNEYILPVKYQNVGFGISVIVAGLEQNYQNYKEIKISIDGENYIQTQVDYNNIDCSNIITFDNLIENQYYTIYAELILNDNSIININTKILPQLESYTVELSQEMKMKYYTGGGLIHNIIPKEVI